MKHVTYDALIDDQNYFSTRDIVRYSCNKEGLNELSDVIATLKEQLEISLKKYEVKDMLLDHSDDCLLKQIFALEHLESEIHDLAGRF